MTPLHIGIGSTPLQKEDRRLKKLAYQKAFKAAVKAATAKPKKEPKRVTSAARLQAIYKWEEANPDKVKANQARCYQKAKLASQSRIAAAMAQVDATLKKMDNDFEDD